MEINLLGILKKLILIVLLLVLGYFSTISVKKQWRLHEIERELKSLSSDTVFFGQCSGYDASKKLIRAVGLIAEASKLGSEPDETINRALGLGKEWFEMSGGKDKATPRQKLIRRTLRKNYDNVLMFGYTADAETLKSMQSGVLPAIKSGERAGKRPAIRAVISSDMSDGMIRILANIEIRADETPKSVITDVDRAAAMHLAKELNEAGVIDDLAIRKIVEKLKQGEPATEKK